MQYLISWGKGLLISSLLMGTLAAQTYSRSGQPAPPEAKAMARNVGCGGEALLFEPFDGPALPAAWTSLDEDDGVPNPNIQFITPQGGWQVITDLKDSTNGNRSVASPSWYEDETQPSSDWLILPQTQALLGNVCFSFVAYSQDPTYPESYEVRVSTTGNTPADFLQQAPLLTVEEESGSFSYRSIDLSAYAGEQIYLAIHHTSLDAFILVMDDFRLAQVKRRDLAVFSFQELNNPEPGIEYFIQGSLVNRGLDSLFFAEGEVVVGYETYGNIRRDAIDRVIALGPNDTLRFRHEDLWEPPVQNLYGFNLFIEPIEGDEDLSNDTLFVQIPVGVTTIATPLGEGWTISPNPTRDNLRLQFDAPLVQATRLTLADLTGRRVRPSQLLAAGQRQYQLSLAGLPRGLYVLELRDESGRRWQAKVMKQ